MTPSDLEYRVFRALHDESDNYAVECLEELTRRAEAAEVSEAVGSLVRVMRERDTLRARVEELEGALGDLRDGCDGLMGDSYLDYDDSPGMRAMQRDEKET